jgi:hypothetical protein
MMPRPIDFLPESINENLAAATLLTDEIVPVALRMVHEHAQEHSFTDNVMKSACMDGAALMYERCASTLRVLKHINSNEDYARGARCVLMRVAVADSLTHRAGLNYEIANALGHLAPPLGDNADERDAVAANEDLKRRLRELAGAEEGADQ